MTQKNATPTFLVKVVERSIDATNFRYARYAGGSPGFELRFVYIVSDGRLRRQRDLNFGAATRTAQSANTIFRWYGGSIKGEDGKTADRRYTGRGDDSGHKVKASVVSLEGAVTSGDGERIVLTFHKSTHGELYLPVDTELAAASADAPVTVRVAGAAA